MCWQSISLKDPLRFLILSPTFIYFILSFGSWHYFFSIFIYLLWSVSALCSQELLEGVERERNFRLNPSRNATIFHHPTLGDFELQHVSILLLLLWKYIYTVIMHCVILYSRTVASWSK